MTIRCFGLALFLLCGLAPGAGPVPAAAARWRMSSPFGLRRDPLGGGLRMHDGIDLPVPMGAPIRAAAAGRVRYAGPRGGYGGFIELGHADGARTRYGHLSRILVTAGQVVAQGEVIGAAGSTGHSTGPHLHFEYWTRQGPVDPLPYFGISAPRPGRAWHMAPATPPPPSPVAWQSAFAARRRAPAPAALPDGDAVAAALAR